MTHRHRQSLRQLVAAPLFLLLTACASASLSEGGRAPPVDHQRVDVLQLEGPYHTSPDAESLDARREGVRMQGAGSQDSGEPPWVQVFNKLKLYGDFRLRGESDFGRQDKADRQRARLRLRVGLNYEINDQFLVGARIVTGDPDDPNSSHVTLGDSFDKLEFSLDRAFVTWRPAGFEGSEFTAGKFNNPYFHNDVYSELVWDGDVQPEGAYFRQSQSDIVGLDDLEVILGAYSMLEQSSGDDSYLAVAQVSGRKRLSRRLESAVGLSYTHYTDVNPDGTTTVFDQNRGNAAFDSNGDGKPDSYSSEFGIVNVIAELRYDGASRPTVMTAEWIQNARSTISGDSGWSIGIAHGSTAKKGDWRGYYQWQVIEQDAVFSPFAQDDFLLATNHRSHLLGINYQVSDKAGLHFWGLVSQVNDAGQGQDETDAWRLRLDLNVKF